MRRWYPAAIVAVTASACGARSELDVPAEDHAGASDVRVVDAPTEAEDVGVVDALPACDFGTVVARIDGSVAYWNGGHPVPAGHYRVRYVDGCMKYSATQGWTVNAYAAGPDTYWIVGGATPTKLAVPPGTVGFLVSQGGFATFDDCVSANASGPPVDIDFAGGAIGVELEDYPYSDNVPGENGRNPTWRLSSCN
ncbi:MAG TPA: hypothetical protein VLM85_22350 [Polyangiaceae bacterium]|nr:hypothetical protein [Polyangiaceae bacterium]